MANKRLYKTTSSSRVAFILNGSTFRVLQAYIREETDKMTLNCIGVRDIVWVFDINKNKVSNHLKKLYEK